MHDIFSLHFNEYWCERNVVFCFMTAPTDLNSLFAEKRVWRQTNAIRKKRKQSHETSDKLISLYFSAWVSDGLFTGMLWQLKMCFRRQWINMQVETNVHIHACWSAGNHEQSLRGQTEEHIKPKLNQLCQYMQRSAALRQSGSFNASLRSPIAELDTLRDHMHARYTVYVCYLHLQQGYLIVWAFWQLEHSVKHCDCILWM